MGGPTQTRQERKEGERDLGQLQRGSVLLSELSVVEGGRRRRQRLDAVEWCQQSRDLELGGTWENCRQP